MARPSGWDILGLDGDPTPGVVESVTALAKQFHDFADDAERAWRDLNSFGGDAAALQWIGQTADAFKSNFGPLPGRMQKLYTSYREAGDALAAYAPKLQAAQSKADTALRQAQDAHADVQRATTAASSAATDLKTAQQDQAANPNQQAVADAKTAHDTAQKNLDAAKAQLDALAKTAHEAYNDRIGAAKDCARALHQAQSDGIHNKHWWEHVGEILSEWGGKIAEIAGDLAPFLDVLALATSWIPGVDVVTAALAEADNLIALAGTALKIVGDGMQGHWGDALLGAGMLALTFVGGRALGKLGKEAEGEAGALSSAERNADGGVGKEVRSAEGNEASVCKDDPIDVVSGQMLTDETDLSLPGVLPVVLRRAYTSGYQTGRLFGPGWSSTLDQRISINAAGIHFAGDDGQQLDYPSPSADEAVLPHRGARWPLVWDRQSDEIRITDPWSGRTWWFATVHHREDAGQIRGLTAITDRNDNRINVLRDPDGMPVAVEHPGYRVAIEAMPTAAGPRISALRLVNGPDSSILVKQFRYDERGRMSGVIDSSGLPLRYEWDDADRITAWVDRLGHRYEYHYDDLGRVVRTSGDGGFLSGSFEYDPANRTTVHTNSLGQTTKFVYDENGHIASETDALGNTSYTRRDRHGRLLSRVDPLGNHLRFDIDDRGDTVRTHRPDGSVVEADYNEFHQVVEARLPDGTVWRRRFDARGNLLSVVDPTGARTTYDVDSNGAVASVTDAEDSVTRVQADRAGLPVTAVDPLGAVTRVVRDAFGRVVTVTDPLGSVTEYHWTVEGKPLFRVDPDGSRTGWEYDAEGQVISAVDPLGGVTRFEPGPFGLITARVDPNGRRYEFDYDTDLKLLTVRNAAGAHWQYDYDDAGRLVERTNGLGERVVLERDANGQVVSRRTPAGDFAYSYDAAGRLAAAAGPAGTVEFVHDAAGRVVSETVDGRTISYQYDAVGRRVRRETPGGAVSTWSFDAAGRPVMVEGVAGALSFAFDAAGREVERLLGAGGRLTHEYTATGQLSSLRLWASGRPGAAGDPSSRAEPDHLVLGRDWDYRADGVPVEIADSAGDRRRFTSDATGRVTAVRAATWTESYAYDDFGNVVLADDSRDTTPDGRYETDRTLVRRRGRTSYEYDAAGRLVRATTRTLDGRKKTATYTWDFEDRLTQTQTPDGAVWRYSYDALGRRTSKARVADDGAVLELVTFAWEGFRLAEQRTAAPDGSVVDLTWDYEPNSFRPAAQYSRTWRSETDQAEVDQTFRAIVSDLVGSPTELVTSDGTVTWRSAGGLWGRGAATPAAPGTECPLRFPGQYFDAETGLHYNLHRYYDPRTAAYLTPDPLGLAPAANDHAYVPNPLVWLDPLGLSGCTVTVYRAQTAGGHSERVLIDGEGNVSVTGENMLHVNMSGDIAHTESFGGAGKQIVAFDVPKSFVDKVRTAAIEQRRPSGMSRRQWNIFSSGRPQIDDPKVASDLYGIPHDLFGGENFSELVNAVIPGSGRVVR